MSDDDSDDGRRARDLLTTPLATVREVAGNNRRASYAVALALLVAWWAGWLPKSPLPSWWPVALVGGGVAYAGGRQATQRILDMLPDEEGILIVSFEADSRGGARIYELSEDRFDDMRVLGGDLFQWPETSRRVYEVREYLPEHNIARANWRETKPASALASPPTVETALTAITELREDLEPEAAKGKTLQRRIRGIVRRLDAERAEAQRDILDENVAPGVGDETQISRIISEELNEDLHPEMIDASEFVDDGGEPTASGASVDVSADATGDAAAATDGGQPDDGRGDERDG